MKGGALYTEAEEHVTIWGGRKYNRKLGIVDSSWNSTWLRTHKNISTSSTTISWKLHMRNYHTIMLKNDFQPMLVNFWCGNLGGPKASILKSGGAVAPRPPWFLRLCYMHAPHQDANSTPPFWKVWPRAWKPQRRVGKTGSIIGRFEKN